MSITTIQFGQCGNQIGHELFSLLSRDTESSRSQDADYNVESGNRWFYQASDFGKPFARAVLVDTEQKVIEDLHKQQSGLQCTWCYDTCNIAFQKGGGAGNNWAYGYTKKGPELQDQVMEGVRRNVEKCDRLLAILSLTSSAGGTGSGVGSHIAECLRDEFASKTLVHAVVLPYSDGEVATQNYNTLLTLSTLLNNSDMLLVFQNSHLHKMCSALLKMNNVQLSDLNSLIARKIASVFQPVQNSSLGDIVEQLTPHPGYRLVTLRTAPHISQTVLNYEPSVPWQSLVWHVKNTIRVNSLLSWETRPLSSSVHSGVRFAPCVANLLITRGQSSAELKDNVMELTQDDLYPQWVPCNYRCLHLHQDKCLLNLNKHVTLATNNHNIHAPLDDIVAEAWNIYSHKAYLHQYSKYNIHSEDFLEAFGKIESVIKTYKNLYKF